MHTVHVGLTGDLSVMGRCKKHLYLRATYQTSIVDGNYCVYRCTVWAKNGANSHFACIFHTL